MYCSNCGAQLNDADRFCTNCGQKVEAQPAPPAAQTVTPYEAEPADRNNDVGYRSGEYHAGAADSYYAALASQPDMGWHKVLAYGLMLIGSVVNILGGLALTTGMGRISQSLMPTRQEHIFTVLMGILTLALGIWQLIVRHGLIRFRKDAPGNLTVFYVMAIALDLLLGAVLYFIGGLSFAESFPLVQLVLKAVLLVVNIGYYKKRSYMFVN